MMDDEIKMFVNQARRVAELGLCSCSSGNLSWRIGNRVLMSATGAWLGDLKADQVAICDLYSGHSVNGVKPSMEGGFHLGVMKKRKDVGVVLHFQSPFATQVACSKVRPENYNVTLEMPLYVGPRVSEVPFLMPGSQELAEKVIEGLEENNMCLMLNHGEVTCGKDFDEVVRRAVFFEMACRICVQANMDPMVIDAAEVEKLSLMNK